MCEYSISADVLFRFGRKNEPKLNSFFVLQCLAYLIHDARLYGSVLLSYCIAALCAVHAVFFHPHVVQMCCLLNNTDKYWPSSVMCGNRETGL